MAVFLWDEFQMLATASSIRRGLVSKSWSKKTARQSAKGQSAELREVHFLTSPTLIRTTFFMLLNLDTIDELASDGQAGYHLV